MIFKNNKIIWIFIFVISFVFISFSDAYALRVIPQRLVIGPDVKVEHMFIKNNSEKTETYRFGWKHMAMDKEGNVLNLDKLGLENAPEGYKPLNDIVRFSPRRATLQPGQTQRVTFMVNRSKMKEDGEYRSHFLFQREENKKTPDIVLPEETENNTQNNASDTIENSEESRPNVAFDVLISRAVPIYVINGNANADLKFIQAKIIKNANKADPKQPDYLAQFKVKKEGNISVIGVAQILCTSNGKEIDISKPAKVFAVYAEGEFRNENMGIQIPAEGCQSYKLFVKGHADSPLSGKTLINQTF